MVHNNIVKNWILAFIFAVFAGGSLMVVSVPQIANAVPAADPCNSGFLGFPSWYRGLTIDAPEPCGIMSPAQAGGLSPFIWTIGLNIAEMALVAVAYISGFAFLYGGFLFIISQGKPEGAAKARSTIFESIIGLLISLGAIAIVDFVVMGILK